MTANRLSMLYLYIRIFGILKSFWNVVYITGFLLLASGIALLFAYAFQCTPVDKAWRFDRPGTCINLRVLIYVTSAESILATAWLVLLPMKVIFSLELPRSSQWALAVLFLFGFW